MSSKFLFPRSSPQPPLSFDQFLTVPIGKGSYGTVFRGIHKRTFQKYAIKQIFKKNHSRLIHYQLQILYSIDCDNIVRLYDHFETETSVCLLMEYVEGRQLFDGIISKKIKLSYQQVAKIVHQLCNALKYIHDLKIIHRDVKPENILLAKDNKLKLADFGAANYLTDNESRRTFIGTPQYMAPELLYDNEQSSAVDIWAVGVILYELTTMKLPFTAKTTARIYENIKSIKYEFPVSLERDRDLKELIKSILVANPKDRPSAQQIIQHSWIQNNLKQGKFIVSNQIVPVNQEVQAQQYNQNMIELPVEILQNQNQQIKILPNPEKFQQPLNQTIQNCQQQSPQQQKYLIQLQKKINLLQTKIGVSKKLKQKKQKIIQTNRLHMQQLHIEIDSHVQFKQQLQSIQNQIRNGDTRYFAALEERTKLKSHQFKLKQQINKYKLIQRKNSGSEKKIDGMDKKRNFITTSTISSSRMLSQQKQKTYLKSHNPLQKSLSFSILQIQTLLSQIRQKKQRISGTSSSPNIRI